MVPFGKVFSTLMKRVDKVEEGGKLRTGRGQGVPSQGKGREQMWPERYSEGGMVERL